MKKLMQTLTFLIIAAGISAANAVREEDNNNREMYAHTTQAPDFSRKSKESAHDYVLKMDKLWSNSPDHQRLIEETLEEERKKQQRKWNNLVGLGHRISEIFMVDPWSSGTAIFSTAMFGYFTGGWSMLIPLAYDVWVLGQNYTLASGSDKELLWGFGWSWGSAKDTKRLKLKD